MTQRCQSGVRLAGEEWTVREIALYYPYIQFRDERWLKAAALYWPRMARVIPDGYPVADTDTVRVLTDELGFIVPVPPDAAARAVAPLFLGILNAHQDRLVTALEGPWPARRRCIATRWRRACAMR